MHLELLNLYSLYAETSLYCRLRIRQVIVLSTATSMQKGCVRAKNQVKTVGCSLYKCSSYSEKGLWSPGQEDSLPVVVRRWSERKKDGFPGRGIAKAKLRNVFV